MNVTTTAQASEPLPHRSAAAPPRYRERLQSLRRRLEDQGWSALLVLNGADIRYLTGLSSSNAALVVTRVASYLATDSRYVAKARALAPEYQPDQWRVVQLDQSLFDALGRNLAEWTGGGAVAYEPTSLSHRSFLSLTEQLDSSVTLRAADGEVGRIRHVKDDTELAAIRRAASLLDDAFRMVESEGIVGKRERDVAWAIEKLVRDAGAEGMSFESIVASGPNGAYPHHTTGDRVIGRDELVTIDIGCVVDGYCSDCTRTFSTGDINDELQRIYDLTLRAQQAGLEALTPGVTGKQVDEAARSVIDDAGFGQYFGHGLGHGVGIEIHEGPRLSRTAETVLQPGMVVTVEPGVYVPEVGGVRIEDLVVVGEPNDVLTSYPRNLVSVE